MEEKELKKLKSGGIIKQSKNDLFLARLKIPFGDIEANKLKKASEVALKYGSGNIHLTVRQGIEINDIKFEDLKKATAELEKAGLELGACGPRVRVVIACPGNSVCPKGLGDTKSLSNKLNKKYFGLNLPHKFKISVTGCPNSCSKPQENDLGFMAVSQPVLDESQNECISCDICAQNCKENAITMIDGKPKINLSKCSNDGICIQVCPTGSIVAKKTGWKVFIGGRFGRKPKLGSLFSEFISNEKAIKLTGSIINTFKNNTKKGQRLGVFIDEIGLSSFKDLVKNESQN